MSKLSLSKRSFFVCLLPASVSLICCVPLYAQQAAPANSDSNYPQGSLHVFLNTGGHTGPVTQVLWLPGSKDLVTVSEDKSIRFWNAKTGESLGTYYCAIGPGTVGEIYAADLNGKFLAVGGHTPQGNKDVVRVLEIHGTTPLQVDCTQSLSEDSPSFALAFSHDGTRLASADSWGNVKIWKRTDAAGAFDNDSNAVNVLPDNGDKENDVVPDAIAFSPDDASLAACYSSGEVDVWNISEKRKTLLGKQTGGGPVAWTKTANGELIASGGSDGSIMLWNPSTHWNRRIVKENKPILSLAFDPQGRSLAWGGGDQNSGFARVWSGNLRSDDPSSGAHDLPHDGMVVALCFSPDGDAVATGGAGTDGVYVWDSATGQQRQKIVGKGTGISQIAWSADGSRLAWVSAGTRAFGDYDFVYDLTKAAPITSLSDWQPQSEDASGWSCQISNDHHSVTVTRNGQTIGTVSMKKVYAALRPDSPQAQDDDIQRCVVSPVSHHLFIGAQLTLTECDDKGTPLRFLVGHTRPITALSISPKGDHLASGSDDQTVNIWALNTDSTTPLISLFADKDGRWLAWTQPGLFASSTDGDDLIAWLQNPDVDEVVSPAVIWQFKGYRNPAALVQAAQTDQAPEPSVSLQDATPPVITDVSVTDENGAKLNYGDATNSKTVTVTATVDGKGQAIKQVLFIQNYHVLSASPTQEGKAWSQSVTLQPGDNDLTVAAVNSADSESQPQDFQVQSTIPINHKPRLYVLSIGIADYPGGDTYRLLFPSDDAKSVAAVFQDQAGRLFDANNVHVQPLLLDKDATQQNIEKALNKLVSDTQNYDLTDWVVVYLAGHGYAKGSDHPFCFVPYDVDPTNGDTVEQTSVPYTFLQNRLSHVGGKVLLLLDACDSGGANGALSDAMDKTSDDSRTGSDKVVIFAASGSSGTSQEWLPWHHGAFTKALIEGMMGGRPDYNTADHGKVTISSLQNFLSYRLHQLSQEHYAAMQKDSQATLAQREETTQTPDFQVNTKIGDEIIAQTSNAVVGTSDPSAIQVAQGH